MRTSLSLYVVAGLLLLGACEDEERPPFGGPGSGFVGGTVGGGSGGGDGGDADSCEGPPGLWMEGSCTELADGVRHFQPAHVLWSDGAAKDRFIFLPLGSQIDTSDPDGWIFPVGTRIYKTFRDGTLRLETRLLEKVVEGTGVGAWRLVSFAWNEAQDAVTEVPAGRRDVLGTGYDIPSTEQCIECHAPVMRDVALGFSAIQLNHSLPGLSLESLQGEGRLTVPISTELAVVPGDHVAQAALGYLHANCGNCHGGAFAPAGLRTQLFVGDANVETTETSITSVGIPSQWASPGITARIEAGAPETSAVPARMRVRGTIDQMPPIGSEVVDIVGVRSVEAFIEGL